MAFDTESYRMRYHGLGIMVIGIAVVSAVLLNIFIYHNKKDKVEKVEVWNTRL